MTATPTSDLRELMRLTTSGTGSRASMSPGGARCSQLQGAGPGTEEMSDPDLSLPLLPLAGQLVSPVRHVLDLAELVP